MGPGKRCPILDNGYLTTPTPPLCPLSDWITIVLMTSANIRTVQAKNSNGPQQIVLSRSTFPGTFNAHTAKLHGLLCPFGTGVVEHQQLQDFGCLEPCPKMWPSWHARLSEYHFMIASSAWFAARHQFGAKRLWQRDMPVSCRSKLAHENPPRSVNLARLKLPTLPAGWAVSRPGERVWGPHQVCHAAMAVRFVL